MTAHAAPVVQVGGCATGNDCGAGTLTMRLRRPGGSTGLTRPGADAGGEEYDSAGEGCDTSPGRVDGDLAAGGRTVEVCNTSPAGRFYGDLGGGSFDVIGEDCDTTPNRVDADFDRADFNGTGEDFDTSPSRGDRDIGRRDFDSLSGRFDGDPGGRDFDSAGEDDVEGASTCRPPAKPSSEPSSTPVAGHQLTLRTARRTSATLTPQSTLEFKYSETKV